MDARHHYSVVLFNPQHAHICTFYFLKIGHLRIAVSEHTVKVVVLNQIPDAAARERGKLVTGQD